MCSVDDQEISDVFENSCRSVDTSRCTKCGGESVIVLRVDDALCRECFVPRVTHKFRAEFGKHRLVRDNEEVLVAYSGGRKSSAMMHLMIEGKSKRAMKKLRFIPVLVHIIESTVEDGDTLNRTKQIVTEMQNTGLKYYVYAFEQVFCSELSPLFSHEIETYAENLLEREMEKLAEERNRLRTLIAACTISTAREALIEQLRRRLLLWAAKIRGKLVVGDCSVDLAVRLISHVTQGRGAQVSHEMSFADSQDPEVMVLRPLREFTMAEINLYNEMNNIVPAKSALEDMTPSTIKSLCYNFITGLQDQHENTLSIICRTGQKLTTSEEVNADKNNHCCLCLGPLDTNSSAMNATKFSQSVCQELQTKCSANSTASKKEINSSPASCEPSNGCTSHEYCSSARTDESLTCEDLKQQMCYGCFLISKGIDDVERFPAFVVDAALLQKQRKQMKRDIEEFLIADAG